MDTASPRSASLEPSEIAAALAEVEARIEDHARKVQAAELLVASPDGSQAARTEAQAFLATAEQVFAELKLMQRCRSLLLQTSQFLETCIVKPERHAGRPAVDPQVSA